jgi:methyl-accepting chemotaxis protein
MQLTIKQKLFVLVSLALLALLCVGLFSFFQASKLNEASSRSMERHVLLIETIDKARGAQVRFKTQVQEWKNILLRGKDPKPSPGISSNSTRKKSSSRSA